MICKHCRREIPMRAESARLDAGVRLSDGTRIPHDVSLHLECEGAWWLANHPVLAGKVYERHS